MDLTAGGMEMKGSEWTGNGILIVVVVIAKKQCGGGKSDKLNRHSAMFSSRQTNLLSLRQRIMDHSVDRANQHESIILCFLACFVGLSLGFSFLPFFLLYFIRIRRIMEI